MQTVQFQHIILHALNMESLLNWACFILYDWYTTSKNECVPRGFSLKHNLWFISGVEYYWDTTYIFEWIILLEFGAERLIFALSLTH